ncbi:cellular morphogenesis regulator dopa [Bimuria novae-zelandiae CBS 107.79]|uniref:Cellular morphogenesis regulator dopa n=1 Tax=Bimuria novae-zelandiae CBS 107.79 TaxID=1447943 RepID=A0A6A5V5R7_9PLEO|nr:cellular morphogenesis regulator dopa [Bimuria novae-zelandiae CBS 107.79]
MAHDSSANLQILSPTGSGRSSPSPRVTRNNTEDALQKKDKSFRRYAQGVDRALALWDTAQQEWADYISFLGRLLKALQSHPPETTVIPHSDAVALRLAQCLNPTLPSGVHQKALEVYSYIFATIGKAALARDLNLYFPGLSSVLSFASLSVRPLFLSVYESHILKLDGSALRPALKAVILSLLPGLEDETSEDFDRMVSALDRLREAVKNDSEEFTDAKTEGGSSHFWQCFFLATITNASRRQGALAYLVRRLPKFQLPQRRVSVASQSGVPTEGLPAEAEAATSPEPGLLIRCFEAGLYDAQLLIQRGFLDLLVTHLPLDSPVLQNRIGKEDRERIVAAAASVVSRRDMSLNRRLWAWFLGPELSAATDGEDESVASPTQDKQGAASDPSAYHAAYFSRFGLEALTRSVLKMINRPTKLPAERAKPFRVCLSLMDRWEVGGLIVPEIFLPALQSIHAYSEVATKDQVDEVLRSASTFFDGVDSGLIWGKLIELVTTSLKSEDSSRHDALQQMRLAKFVMSHFNLKEEDMMLHHMPLMIVSSLSALNGAVGSGSKLSFKDQELVDLTLEIVDSLVQIVPDRAIRGRQSDHRTEQKHGSTKSVASEKIQAFYEESQGSSDVAEPPFTAAEIGHLILEDATRLFLALVQLHPEISAEMPAKILANAIVKVQQFEGLNNMEPFAVIEQVLSRHSSTTNRQLPFSHLTATTTILTGLQIARPSDPYISESQIAELVHPLVAAFWQYLSPLMPKHHVEAARCILQLHSMSPSNRVVEAALSSILVQDILQRPSSLGAADASRRFAVLWTHTMYELSLQSERRGTLSRRTSTMSLSSFATQEINFHTVLMRPLLLLLDLLSEDGTDAAAVVNMWLQDLPTLNKIFEILVIRLQSLHCLSTSDSLAPGMAAQQKTSQNTVDDSKDCLYFLRHIHNILKRPLQYTWATLAQEPAPRFNDTAPRVSLQEWIVRTCLKTLSLNVNKAATNETAHLHELYRVSVEIVSQIYNSPFAPALRDLEFEIPLMACLRTAGPTLQSVLLGASLLALRLRTIRPTEEQQPPEQRAQNSAPYKPRLSLATSRDSVDVEPPPIPPPPQLVEIIKYGFSSSSSRLVLDDWVNFLVEVLPLFADAIFQSLLPLVECFCKEIRSTFEQLKSIFCTKEVVNEISPESTLISLINGLEQILARAHDRLMVQENKSVANKSPEQPQGFFGNMVSGVFSSEAHQARTPTANSRLTVLLCFQDTVRICFAIWSWGGYAQNSAQHDATSASSFGYTSLRMRNRARRILEHLFAAEALECLETLAVLWSHSSQNDTQATAIMGLLNVLNGSKPKHTIPAIFNAVYSRTNPNALDSNRISTLTSDLTDADLVAFLVDYTKSLEDDAMDEIWQDCTLFLRDVLANPLPHRQILPLLLEFTAVIGQKVDNTNFGEQRKMRKELADIFQRILTAVFTTRSMGFLQDPGQVKSTEKPSAVTNGSLSQRRATDVVSVLNTIVPYLPIILVENERVTTVVTNIATSVIGPTFRTKAFPDNVTKPILDLLQALARVAQGNKFWKKELTDAFNDARFFATPLPLLKESWLPILSQWASSDKDRLPELLSRLSAPTTAGIMFGVGASSARQEADRKTQLTLRRIALLVLASAVDAFTPALPSIMEKLVELLAATPASSPSSATRADALILLRVLILKTSNIHLAPLWPTINAELTSALSSLLPDAPNRESYNNAGVLQACKLLDELVVLDPDDFQLMEWLYVCDTIDAVYKPPPSTASSSSTYPSNLADEIAEVLSARAAPLAQAQPQALHADNGAGEEGKRKLFLDPLIEALEREERVEVMEMSREALVERVVRPFLGSLGMWAFETRYRGGEVDGEGVWGSVVRDARGD